MELCVFYEILLKQKAALLFMYIHSSKKGSLIKIEERIIQFTAWRANPLRNAIWLKKACRKEDQGEGLLLVWLMVDFHERVCRFWHISECFFVQDWQMWQDDEIWSQAIFNWLSIFDNFAFLFCCQYASTCDFCVIN